MTDILRDVCTYLTYAQSVTYGFNSLILYDSLCIKYIPTYQGRSAGLPASHLVYVASLNQDIITKLL